MVEMTVDEALSLALRHHQAGDLATAESLYRAVLGALPQQPDALHLLGVAAQQQGRAEEAAALIAEALQHRPTFPEAHNNRGNALRDLGRRDEAAAHYRTALDQRPGYARALRNLADTLYDLGRPGEAAEHYRAALATESTAADLRNNLGNALRAVNNGPAALAAFRTALCLQPDFAEALGNLGTTLVDEEDAAGAAAALARALRLRPDMPAARLARVAALRTLGRDTDAAARAALALTPAEPRAADARLRAAFDRGDDATAALWHRRAARLSGPHLSGPKAEPARALRITPVSAWCAANALPYRTILPARARTVATGSPTWGTLTYDLPESFLARVDEAVLIPSNLSVATTGGALLLDGLHAYSRRSLGAPHFLHESPDGRMLAAIPEPSIRIDDEAILLGGDGNFAHGVLDWLSRTLVLDRCPELAGLPVLVASALRPGVLELLAALGVAPDRLVRLPPGATVSCRRLWVPSLTHHFQYMAPEYLDFLRARVAAAYGAPAARPGRRLYLSRPATGHRALLNEAAVLDALRPFGVEPLRPEALSMAEQIRRFAEAELIVMPVGGGSAGIAFAPPTAGVVELTHSRCVLPQYGILAALLGQRYEQLVGTPVVNRGTLNFDWDFTVPPEEVAAAVGRVLGRRA